MITHCKCCRHKLKAYEKMGRVKYCNFCRVTNNDRMRIPDRLQRKIKTMQKNLTMKNLRIKKLEQKLKNEILENK